MELKAIAEMTDWLLISNVKQNIYFAGSPYFMKEKRNRSCVFFWEKNRRNDTTQNVTTEH
jgi:hypothetical protein